MGDRKRRASTDGMPARIGKTVPAAWRRGLDGCRGVRPCGAARRRSRPDCGPAPFPAGKSCPPSCGQSAGKLMVSRNAAGAWTQEVLDLQLVFGGEHRAGRVQQAAAGREQRPERRQDALLLRGERRDVALAPQPLDVRDAAARRPTPCTGRRPGCGRTAGRPTSPPARRRRPTAARIDGPASAAARGSARTRSIRAGVAVERQQVDVGEFGDVRRSCRPARRTRRARACRRARPAAARPAARRRPAPRTRLRQSRAAPVTGRGVVTMRPAAPTGTVATSAAAIAAASASRVVARRLTRSVSGGRSLPTSRMRCQWCGWSASTRPIHQRGYDQRATGLAATAARLSASRSRR